MEFIVGMKTKKQSDKAKSGVHQANERQKPPLVQRKKEYINIKREQVATYFY